MTSQTTKRNLVLPLLLALAVLGLPMPLHARAKNDDYGADSTTSGLWAETGSATGKTLFLPQIYAPGQNSLVQAICSSTTNEARFIELIETHPDQGRAQLNCNPTLSEVARRHALDMAARGYFSHVSPENLGSNARVLASGYDLPAHYSREPTGNNIESIAAGFDDPEILFATVLGLDHHRRHLLGLSDFYAEQVEYGIGYAFDPASIYKHYWVIITAPTTR